MLGGLRNKLFSRKLSGLNGITGVLVRCLRVTWFTVGEFRRDFCLERAATLSFATIISLIPLAVLLLGIAVQFDVGDSFIKYAEEKVFPYLAPSFKGDLSAWLENNLSKKAFANSVAGVVGLLALASLIVTAMGGFAAAERIFNRLWKVEGTRTYLQKLLLFWVLLTVSPFIVTPSRWIESSLVPQDGVIERLTQQSIILKSLYNFLVPVFVGFVGFTVVYRYLPAARVKLRSAMLGGLVAAVLWEVSKRGFSVYVERSTTITSLYGPLSIVPVFLVWVYLTWVIILWGCELAYAHQNLAVLSDLLEERSSRTRKLAPAFVGMYLLERLASAFCAGAALPDASAIGEELSIPTSEVESAGRRLVEARTLVEDARRAGAYSLVKAPAFVQLSEVVAALPGEESHLLATDDHSQGQCHGTRHSGRPGPLATAELFREARSCYLGAFTAKTLEDLIAVAPHRISADTAKTSAEAER